LNEDYINENQNFIAKLNQISIKLSNEKNKFKETLEKHGEKDKNDEKLTMELTEENEKRKNKEKKVDKKEEGKKKENEKKENKENRTVSNKKRKRESNQLNNEN